MSNQDLDGLPAIKINVPSFLLKTYEILENPALSNVIAWNQEGNAFIVYNSNELSSRVLANYFKHKNYPSFLRQLNMYNFKKTKNQYGQSEFRHKWFRRGLKSMLQYIRRRNQEESDGKIEAKEKDHELDYYKKDHEEMKQLLREVQQNQTKITNDFATSKDQCMQTQKQNQSIIQCIHHVQNGFNKKFDSIAMILAKVVSNVPHLQQQLGEILKIALGQDEQTQSYYPQIENKTDFHNIVQYSDQHYSNVSSPYPSYVYNSPVNYLYQRQQQQIPEYYFQFDPQIFMMNRNVQPLALPPAIPQSYLSSNNYSVQSSAQSSPYRIPNQNHSSTTESKSVVDKFNLYQQNV